LSSNKVLAPQTLDEVPETEWESSDTELIDDSVFEELVRLEKKRTSFLSPLPPASPSTPELDQEHGVDVVVRRAGTAATAAAITETAAAASTQVVVATTAGTEGGRKRRKSQRTTRPSKKVLENIADMETVNEEKAAGEIRKTARRSKWVATEAAKARLNALEP
jgi:hypothetical protein